jgi:hypothetical protein
MREYRCLSLAILLERGWSSSYGILERAKRGGSGPQPSANWAENALTTERKWGSPCSLVYSLVCGLT